MAPPRLFVDPRPLRESPAFRRLWAGTAVSQAGSQMTLFAVALQVYELTRSSVAVGAIGLCMALPSVAFALFGGALGDTMDRRLLTLTTSSGLAAVSVLLAAQAFAGNNHLWLLYVLVVVQSLLASINAPARRALLPRLLPKEQIPAGAALTMLTMHASAIAGPALAGEATALWGLKACYLIDALSFAAALYGIVRLPAMRPDGSVARPGLRAVGDALRLIRGDRVLGGAFLADLSVTVLGVPVALFPAINAERFGGVAQTLGLLSSATAVGGLIGAVLSGWPSRVSRQGRAQLALCAVWGAAITGFGLAHSLGLALVMLAMAGAVDTVSVVFRTTMIQLATPDSYRGRVSAAEYVVGVGGPQLGNFRAGVIGSLASPSASAVGGGLITVAAAVAIALAMPAFIRHEAHVAQY
jgi:MFS family permease